MGGVAGHMDHLYENRELTFGEMKEILELSNYDPDAPEIESFKTNVDLYGFLHGYYLKSLI